MSLTGLPFFLLTVAIAVLLFAVVVFAAPYWTKRPWHAIPRALSALAFALATILALAVGMNRDNLWFTSWEDLGGSTEVAQSSGTGADALSAAGNPGTATATPSPTEDIAKAIAARPALPAPEARMQRYTYQGDASGLTGTISVILPKNYDHKAAPGTYPVIIAMHGIPGSPEGWTDKLKLGEYVDKAVANKEIAAPIVVVPQLQFPAGKDNECLDEQEKVETWLSTDMATFATSHFGVKTERGAWASLGYSAGGWCAAMVGMRHTDIYGAAISLDGYFSPVFDGQDNSKYKRGPYDLVHLAATKKPAIALYIQGAQQGTYWPETKAFVDAVQAPTSVTSVLLKTGGHRWSTWERQLPGVMTWLGKSVPGFVVQ